MPRLSAYRNTVFIAVTKTVKINMPRFEAELFCQYSDFFRGGVPNVFSSREPIVQNFYFNTLLCDV